MTQYWQDQDQDGEANCEASPTFDYCPGTQPEHWYDWCGDDEDDCGGGDAIALDGSDIGINYRGHSVDTYPYWIGEYVTKLDDYSGTGNSSI